LREDDVEVPILIEISVGKTSTHDGFFQRFAVRDLGKPAGPGVPEQLSGFRMVDLALHLVDVWFDVAVRDHEIKKAI
jgi:hypothetical protein